ncbi:patched domain-containing protein 3-like [Mercenaria mercenaria]|uniref:patched domain-containing protein 3-like n=1 Tax=Mercenaria mercenaria TaxID=6596 RepID=UPI00234F2448|nr:patched domain-containing protein 3-like [Mercenaria mercenaria]
MYYTEKMKVVFGSLALHIASHCWKVCIVGFLLNGLLGLGMLNLPRKSLLNNDIEEVYMPRETKTGETEQFILNLFPDYSGTDFYTHQAVKQPLYTEFIIWRKNKQSLINDSLYGEIYSLMQGIKNITLHYVNDTAVDYSHLCARRDDKCVTTGEEIIEQLRECKDGMLPLNTFQSENKTIFENPLFQLADYIIENDTLISAMYLKVRFNLRQDTILYEKHSKHWMDRFITHMKQIFELQESKDLSFTFSHSKSFLEELGNDTYTDIPYFSFVFTIYFFYMGFVMSGGNILAKRVNIGRMGIIVTPTSVLGAWGLLMACEVEFTNVIGVAPLFIVGHQIINTMITLSHLSDANDIPDSKLRVEYAVKMSALPVTTTMMCYVVPFTVAIFSKYYAIELVGIYVVATMVFNYVNHFVFYTACLAIHEQRIDAGRHCCICTKLRPREELEGRSCCIICCCSGSRPEKRTDTESSIEKISRKAMLRFLLTTTSKCISLFSYMLLTAFSVWGILNYKVDVLQTNEVLSTSYFHSWNEKHVSFYNETFTIQFVTIHPSGYANDLVTILDFEKKLKSKSFLNNQLLLSWNDLYENSSYVNYTSELALSLSVKNKFIPENNVFSRDIRFDQNDSSILASRCYINTKYTSTMSMISLKKELFDLADEMSDYLEDKYNDIDEHVLPFKTDDKYVSVHSPDFILTDAWKQPLWEYFIFTGTQIGLVICLLFLLKPNLSSLILIPLVYLSMVTCLFGVSRFLGIYLTQVSAIIYMMAGCFFVEVVVHTFYSYFQATGINKAARVNVILGTTSQSLFHAMFGQVLGLLVLFVVRSYVFVTVFRLAILTTGICVIFIILWVPILLSVFGPSATDTKSEILDSYKIDLTSISFDDVKINEQTGVDNPACLHTKRA